MSKSSKMLAEIHEQPGVLQAMLDQCATEVEAAARLIKDRRPAFLVMDARGTSYNAALYGKYLFEAFAGLPVCFTAPSLTTLYGAKVDYSRAVMIGVSQSGASEDLLAAMESAKATGAGTIALCNTAGSALTKLADVKLITPAGKEQAVAATKSFISQLMGLALIAAEVSGSKKLKNALAKVPALVAGALSLEAQVLEQSQRYTATTTCAMLGRGYNLATAYEAALKLTECAYIAAQGFSLAIFEHGPKALATDGFPLFVYAAKGAAYKQAGEAIAAYKQQGAEVTVIANCQRLARKGAFGLRVPGEFDEAVSPIVFTPVGQLFAYGIATAKGYQPDAPRLLNKVTSTR